MATRIENILIRVRDTLADPNAERFSDPRLLRLVDDAQKYIVSQAKLLRKKVAISLINGQAEYDLPLDSHRYIRVLQDDKIALPLYSHEKADTLFGETWESHTGPELKAIIFDKTNTGKIKVYPIPIDSGPDDGEVVYSLTSLYGLTVGFHPTEGEMVGLYGPLIKFTGAPMVSEDLTVYYLKKAADITSVTDELEISDIFDRAIKFFVTGLALRDNLDTQNRTVGNEELQLFRNELAVAIVDGEQDFTAIRTHYSTSYDRSI